MKILITGSEKNFLEWSAILSKDHTLNYQPERPTALEHLRGADVVIDFHDCSKPSATLGIYNRSDAPVFLNSVFGTLTEIREAGQIARHAVYGFNGLPGFFNGCVEAVANDDNDVGALRDLCKSLGIEAVTVKDQVGLVTPRVVCMIINEAYYTVEEGTASRQDIDLAMKLGTNYPFGPFEWCEKIGLANVYRLIVAVSRCTGDDRYKICPLLEKEARDRILLAD